MVPGALVNNFHIMHEVFRPTLWPRTTPSVDTRLYLIQGKKTLENKSKTAETPNCYIQDE